MENKTSNTPQTANDIKSDVISRTWCFNAIKRNEPNEYKISIYLKAIDRISAEENFKVAFPELEWKERFLKTRM
jgi:hypothetical protein